MATNKSDQSGDSQPAHRRGARFRPFMICVYLIIVITGQLAKNQHDHELARDAQTGSATVTQVSCGNNGSIDYSYTVGGKIYFGNVRLKSSCQQYGVGDDIVVYYSARNPLDHLALQDPRASYENDLIFAGVLCIILLGSLGWMVHTWPETKAETSD